MTESQIIPEYDRYFSLKGLSDYCGISWRCLYSYINDLKYTLPHIKLKRKILVKKSEADKWLETFRIIKPGETWNDRKQGKRL